MLVLYKLFPMASAVLLALAGRVRTGKDTCTNQRPCGWGSCCPGLAPNAAAHRAAPVGRIARSRLRGSRPCCPASRGPDLCLGHEETGQIASGGSWFSGRRRALLNRSAWFHRDVDLVSFRSKGVP